MAERPGARFGHYRLIAPIGTGGFATVYRAVDERLDAEVAIKVLAENHALDVEIRERFITEAQLLRRVAGDAVLTIYDMGETEGGQPYMVLDHADRGDLRVRVDELRNTGTSFVEQDLGVVVEILGRSLTSLHAAGVVHRDVKPDNLLLMSEGGPRSSSQLLRDGERLQLGDLGYAKDLSAHSGLTVGGGTQGFAAPEQQTGIGQVTTRADIYGASAVVFWILTGSPPPRGIDAQQLASQGLSPMMCSVLSRGLAEEPQARFDDIGRWADAFGLPKARQTALHQQAVTTPAQTPTGVGRRLRMAVGATALVAGGLIGAVGYAGLSGDDGPTSTRMDDGRVRVADQQDTLQLAIFGPDQALVGQEISFDAAVVGAASFTWVADGVTQQGGPSLRVTPTTSGPLTVSLLGRDTQGRALTVDFTVDVEAG